jgi:hypothetical protein
MVDFTLSSDLALGLRYLHLASSISWFSCCGTEGVHNNPRAYRCVGDLPSFLLLFFPPTIDRGRIDDTIDLDEASKIETVLHIHSVFPEVSTM